jgi:1-acyl-sn-glycerol-3-phosphate acyltransferase
MGQAAAMGPAPARARYDPPMSARRRLPVYALAKAVVPPVIRFWVRMDMQGALHIPPRGPVIIAANHVSYFDPLCLGVFIDSAGRQVRFLAKSELFRNPVLRWILRGAGQIPVYRESRDASRSLSAAVAAMQEGAAVAIYPEGTTTRNADFSPMPAKSGVARLAALTGAPVVPVGMWGAHLLFTRGKLGPFRRGIRVVVRAGPPLDLGLTPDSSPEEISAARDRVMEAIGGLVAQARTGWIPPPWYLRRTAGQRLPP